MTGRYLRNVQKHNILQRRTSNRMLLMRSIPVGRQVHGTNSPRNGCAMQETALKLSNYPLTLGIKHNRSLRPYSSSNPPSDHADGSNKSNNNIHDIFEGLIEHTLKHHPATISKHPTESSSSSLTISRLVQQLGTYYPQLPSIQLDLVQGRILCDRRRILERLLTLLSPPDLDAFKVALSKFSPERDDCEDSRPDDHSMFLLYQKLIPTYHVLFQQLLQHNTQHGLRVILEVRKDIRQILPVLQHPPSVEKDDAHEHVWSLKTLDRYLQSILCTWFAPITNGKGLLELRRITYEETPAVIIEQLAKHEAVHPVQSLQDLRQRLSSSRRVYGLTHPLVPNQLLVVLHVSLQQEVPFSMKAVHEESIEHSPLVATFYSISNLEPGLAGVGLGEHVIHEATNLLRVDFPSIKRFVTLSPLPKFRKWLQEKAMATGKFAAPDLLANEPSLTKELSDKYKCSPSESIKLMIEDLEGGNLDLGKNDLINRVLESLAYHYLVNEKHRGRPLDAVARFHIGNGAILFRINTGADPSRKGLQNSYGVMVNYEYDLEELSRNRTLYESDHRVALSPLVQSKQYHLII